MCIFYHIKSVKSRGFEKFFIFFAFTTPTRITIFGLIMWFLCKKILKKVENHIYKGGKML